MYRKSHHFFIIAGAGAADEFRAGAGGYYVGRTISNAIKSTINMGENARESILDAIEDINKEIISKRKEFGLED